MQRVEELSPALRKRVPKIYQLSGIDRRYTCVPDYVRDPDLPEFEPRDWAVSHLSSTGERNEFYRANVTPLAVEASRAAISDAGIEAGEITHVVAVSCTGFFAPGLDIHLVKSLGLSPETQRTMIGFMGCYAAFNALRLANAFCQADARACVLVVCAELCSLHFQTQNTLESVVVNALFADGCAAAIVRSRTEIELAADSGEKKLVYERGLCRLDDDSMDHMSWAISDKGFLMGLSSDVPNVLAKQLPGYISDLLGCAGLTRDEVEFWAVHPGGRQIVERTQQALALADNEVSDSLAILREYGNMSSPTILFVLKRMMETGAVSSGGHGVALAFGPGLTIEGCLLRCIGGSANSLC